MDRRVKERYNRRVVRRGLSLWSRATNKKEKRRGRGRVSLPFSLPRSIFICHTRFDW